MTGKVTWEDRAKAELRAIDRQMAMRILIAITRFLQTGEGDVKQLQGIDPPEFRLRVGDYRVMFHKLPQSRHILSVAHRGAAYR